MKTKKSIALVLLSTDIGLSIWSYSLLSNYDQYTKIAKTVVASPDFEVQLYKVLLQTLIFTLLLFIFAHSLIYFFYARGNKFCGKYVKVYSLLAAISCVTMIFSGYYWAAVPVILYGGCFLSNNKLKDQNS